MALVKYKDKRTGITYVYESKSYWDKEKKQPRNKRTLIGKIDEETGEIVPTDGRRRKRKAAVKKDTGSDEMLFSKYQKLLNEKITENNQLSVENRQLKKSLAEALESLRKVITKLEENM